MSRAYYNENDPKAAAWLRQLIAAQAIAPGQVDERDIRDVEPRELRGFVQCHFFAGIGVWSHALRRAGFSDARKVWTGSCPCQPFSQSGKGKGFADERHLWPSWHHLIRVERPALVFGEQVASKDGLAWLDLVQSDMEGEGYAFAPLDLCAAGFGAPHIRQRIFFVAESTSQPGRLSKHAGRPEDSETGGRGATRGLANPDARQRGRIAGTKGRGDRERSARRWNESDGQPESCGHLGELADAARARSPRAARGAEQVRRADAEFGGAACGLDNAGRQRRAARRDDHGKDDRVVAGATCELGNADEPRSQGRGGGGDLPDQRIVGPAGVVGGFWRNAEFIPCSDGKYRPVEPGTFPLAHGAPARVGRLRGYGNAIVADVAAEFVAAYLASEAVT